MGSNDVKVPTVSDARILKDKIFQMACKIKLQAIEVGHCIEILKTLGADGGRDSSLPNGPPLRFTSDLYFQRTKHAMFLLRCPRYSFLALYHSVKSFFSSDNFQQNSFILR